MCLLQEKNYVFLGNARKMYTIAQYKHPRVISRKKIQPMSRCMAGLNKCFKGYEVRVLTWYSEIQN